jgi:putative Mg2+ transporter-C (MgtC) family protein
VVAWQLFFDWSVLPEAALKIFLAALLGGSIGLEREMHGQAAGFRTYLLVSTSCSLIMMISLQMEILYRPYGVESAVRVDPGRIASYALAGMGFLGAGAIITGKGSVRGLTTAAAMWMMTAVGLAVGAGFFFPAILVTVVSLFSLYALRYTKPLFRRDIFTVLLLESDDLAGQLKRIEQLIEKYPHTSIQFVSFRKRVDQGMVRFRIKVMSKENMPWKELTHDLAELPGIREVGLEEGRVP